MPLRTILYCAQTFSSLIVTLVGVLFLVVAVSTRFRGVGKIAPVRRQRATDIAAIILAFSLVCFLADFLMNVVFRKDWADPVPLLRPIAMLLILVSISFALFGRGAGKLAILLANVSIMLWLTTIILLSVYIDDLAPIIMR